MGCVIFFIFIFVKCTLYFIYVLLKNRFAWYAQKAEELGFCIEEKYSIPCELCHFIFTNEPLVEKLRPHVTREAERLRMEKLFAV